VKTVGKLLIFVSVNIDLFLFSSHGSEFRMWTTRNWTWSWTTSIITV